MSATAGTTSATTAVSSVDLLLEAAYAGVPSPVGLVRNFDRSLRDRDLRVGVVGLGFTGLPLAHGFAGSGFAVTGVDLDDAKVGSIQRRKSYLPDLADADLQGVAHCLHATTDAGALEGTDVFIICVPTPVTTASSADLSYVWSAVDSIRPHLHPGVLIILQSTVPPGTTAAVGARLVAGTDLVVGRDVYLAMAPERVDPANTAGWGLANTPKLVGGVGAESTRRAALLFEEICTNVHRVSDPAVAELSKVYENTFRLVNIALAIELADLCRPLGVNAREVIEAAATKPFGFLAHFPGAGVGGECIPVDPLFLIERASLEGVDFDVARAAQRRVARRPQQVVARVCELLVGNNTPLDEARVLVVGVSYKPGVADLRNSPGVEIFTRLRGHVHQADFHDSLVPGIDIDGQWLRSVAWTAKTLSTYDVVVLVTAHGALATDPRWAGASTILDTCGVMPPGSNVEAL